MPDNETSRSSPPEAQSATADQPGPAGAPQATEQPATAPPPSLEEQLKAAEEKAARHHDDWLRAVAETENVRKRAQEDVAKASKFAVEKFTQALLPVKDSLEATLVAESATLESLREGVELTLKQLGSAFATGGVTEVNPVGERFDPHRHQAISMLPSEKEPNTVINVLQKGYVLHDRVIRPALVTVAQNKDA